MWIGGGCHCEVWAQVGKWETTKDANVKIDAAWAMMDFTRSADDALQLDLVKSRTRSKPKEIEPEQNKPVGVEISR